MQVELIVKELFRYYLAISMASIIRSGAKEPVELTVIWHSGNLGELLAEMGKEYTKQTGVVIRVELVPWAD